ncbi:acyloxyacyl hydrolase [Leptobacterium sp. I13]|uniref:acyloxyacyl hydrolase n=1 Tax=Leptobacterium meishanense TaxID=3128904 RepID=UPI0030EF5C4D
MKQYFLSVFLSVLFFVDLNAQEKKIRVGFNSGFGTQKSIPFNKKDYNYKTNFYKAQINYTLKEKRKWVFELNIEPGIYIAEHQLLNKFFVQPSRGDDYLEQRERFTKEKTINEYVLNVGIVFKYPIYKKLNTYALVSIGPMYSDTETERLAKGFAFSDILGVGLMYNIKNTFFDIRGSLRHVSNANLQFPNNGHNSVNIEMGVSFKL